MIIFVNKENLKNMLVYKFGGASVKNADGIKQLKSIVDDSKEKLLIVVSAMGKTTNNLEKIVETALEKKQNFMPLIDELKNFHLNIISDLMGEENGSLIAEIDSIFDIIENNCSNLKEYGYDYLYDQVVSYGEILSTKIISAYLNHSGVHNKWVDIRQIITTDDNFRDAGIDIETSANISDKRFIFSDTDCYITQGFIGATANGLNTTLGREGSDYSAAILANFLNAEQVTLWKDVDGIFNADPTVFDDSVLLEELTYQEVIELTFYGAKVIHPKTIKPLKNKQIPLYVRSFYHPHKGGTVIKDQKHQTYIVPVYIIKENQVLLSISLKDLSFVAESHISRLFALLHDFKLKVNLMQNSAISFSVCVDRPRGKEVEKLVNILMNDFRVLYNDGLKLLTIRHYDENSIERAVSGKKVLIEQRSRNTVQFVVEQK